MNGIPPYLTWTRRFRVESIEPAEPDHDGWEAFDIVLRPMDKRGRTNGRTRVLTTAKVGGPPGTVDLTGLVVGVKVDWHHEAGPAPTIRSTVRPGAPSPRVSRAAADRMDEVVG